MQATDLMTREIISVGPDTSVVQAAELMLKNRISGLPVLDATGRLVGMLTEGDLLRRSELGTDRKRPHWLELILSPGKLAAEYVKTHGRKVSDVMTGPAITANEDTPLSEVVSLMNENRIKRIPIVRNGLAIGIVSRADVLRGLAANLEQGAVPVSAADSEIRDTILRELKTQSWAPIALLNVSVTNGVAELWGTLLDERERAAIRVAVENIPGVKALRDHLVFVEPYSGTVVYRPDMASDQQETAPST
ncbi:CBS domain-containing protein [Microvirga alba]|uniref:CBS domain-containing protein n=1 Tax=Microvirga alba TaxID=2791025 RepID=A0A931FRD6_9HYPH|nr:CBS domain-containing protein [Microvirga alba]MBF9232656.1 CBS domain-containing protein [Microvirga alba]